MDTPETASGELDTFQAAAEFAKILDAQSAEAPKPEETKPPVEVPQEPEAKPEEPENAEPEPTEEGEKVTIEVDGKTIELTKAELAERYKSGLRQADYTKKTMEAAEQRKAAEAEQAKAREERNKYAQGLQQAQTLLQAQLQEQSQIDWQKLLDSDPVEYLKQQHLAQARQAKLAQISQEQQQLYARNQQEAAQQMHAFIQTQQQELLAKLPEWKDEAVAKAEKAQIKEFLLERGFDENALNNITDHRAVLLARDAMRYHHMMEKAQASAKKVSQLPTKVERPSSGGANSLDGRSADMKRLQKSGRVEDAARVFASIL